MKIPESVKIGDIIYKVSKVNRINADPELNGQIRYSMGEILLLDASAFPEDYKFNSFLHELIHGIRYHMQMAVEDEDEEEKIVKQFTNGLAMVLADNPDLFK